MEMFKEEELEADRQIQGQVLDTTSPLARPVSTSA
jgi:hypothetical protein